MPDCRYIYIYIVAYALQNHIYEYTRTAQKGDLEKRKGRKMILISPDFRASTLAEPKDSF